MSAFALMLPPARLDELLQRLPAAQRATLKWEGARIRESIQQLVQAPPDNRALVRALHEHLQLSTRLVSDLISVLGDASGVFAEARSSMEKDFAALRAAFQGTDGFSAVEWTTLSVMNFNNVVFTVVEQLIARKTGDPLGSMPDLSSLTPEALDLPGLGVVRAELLVFAMILAINAGARAADLVEHAEWAYLECAAGASALENTGLPLAPFRQESDDHRAARLLRYAAELRLTMDPVTAGAIEEARMGSLQ